MYLYPAFMGLISAVLGFQNMVQYLLENSADIDVQNSMSQTPLMASIEGRHYNISHVSQQSETLSMKIPMLFQLLIEWGCDVHVRGPRDRTAFELVKSDDVRESLIGDFLFTCIRL